MFKRFKKKERFVAIELNDLYIRALSYTEGDLSSAQFHEAILPNDVVVEEVIEDEMQFYEILNELVKQWGIAKHHLRFFVPDHAVLMRTFQHPKELTKSKLKGYVHMEIGESIHLPFENPLIDVHYNPNQEGESVLFATPSEEIIPLIRLYEDVRLEPENLGVRALANLRLLEHMNLFQRGKTYLIVDWSVQATSISIFSENNVDFLRYQAIGETAKEWRYIEIDDGKFQYVYEGDLTGYHGSLIDQTYEIERILNFYQFSLHKGEKSVDEIVIVGEHPEMDFILEQMSSVISQQKITVIDDALIAQKYPNFGAKHAALLGLSLKGVDARDS